ncbi:hypothetical protein [Haloprofundus marisrubri]|uniref:hypothetical protein n=1 Tax=Haloprofundus marisrubri TaxID=1514971 RepID=UPI0014701946|nr:hypothetical protein [Haloprofundus marisrubri]
MQSQGDPRVLLVMNLVLSLLFASVVLYGLDFAGVVAFTWQRLAGATAVLMVLTFLVIR